MTPRAPFMDRCMTGILAGILGCRPDEVVARLLRREADQAGGGGEDMRQPWPAAGDAVHIGFDPGQESGDVLVRGGHVDIHPVTFHCGVDAGLFPIVRGAGLIDGSHPCSGFPVAHDGPSAFSSAATMPHPRSAVRGNDHG